MYIVIVVQTALSNAIIITGVVEVISEDDRVVTRLSDGSYFGGKFSIKYFDLNPSSASFKIRVK